MEYKNAVKFVLDNLNRAPEKKITEIKEIIFSIEEAVKNQLNKNPDLDLDRVEEKINGLFNDELFTIDHPTRSDLYLFKTLEELLKILM